MVPNFCYHKTRTKGEKCQVSFISLPAVQRYTYSQQYCIVHLKIKRVGLTLNVLTGTVSAIATSLDNLKNSMSIPISQFIPPSPSPLTPCPNVCSLHLSSCPANGYHFARFHMYALIYNICFSLSNLLHSV